MGTDIYLSWDKIKKKDKEKQYTGYSINSGDAGYLRASIGMHQENAILRKIFPIEYWEGEGEMRFVFNEKAMAKVSFYGRFYLAHAIMGVPIVKDVENTPENAMLQAILKTIGKSFDSIDTSEIKESDIFFKTTFMKSVFDFFELGYRKEQKELNPKVYISW